MPIEDYKYWCSYYERDEETLSKSITKISNGSYSGDEVMDFLNELDDNAFSNASMVSCLSEIKGRQDKELGNVPLILAVDHYWELQAPYSFDISLKVGASYNNYRSGIDFNISYKWAEKRRVGYYHIEWLSRDFWRDFRAASSVKIRIKQNRDSDYQYYEFSMSGSSNAFKYVTIGHEVIWVEDLAECTIKVFEVMKTKEEQKEAERQREIEQLIKESEKPNDMYDAYNNCLKLYIHNYYGYEYIESDNYCFLHDIDGDGAPELWLVVGSGECCKYLLAYSYEKNSGKVKEVFETEAGHSVFGVVGNIITHWYSHMDVNILSKISFDGKEIIEKSIFESEYVWDDDSEDWIEHVELDVVKDNMPQKDNKLVESTIPDTVSLDNFKELWDNISKSKLKN